MKRYCPLSLLAGRTVDQITYLTICRVNYHLTQVTFGIITAFDMLSVAFHLVTL